MLSFFVLSDIGLRKMSFFERYFQNVTPFVTEALYTEL